jgi:hypothetical protein
MCQRFILPAAIDFDCVYFSDVFSVICFVFTFSCAFCFYTSFLYISRRFSTEFETFMSITNKYKLSFQHANLHARACMLNHGKKYVFSWRSAVIMIG